MVANIKPMTVDEFERFIQMPDQADRLFELINGEPVEKAPAQLHGFRLSVGDIFPPK